MCCFIKAGFSNSGKIYGEVKTFLKRQPDVIIKYKSITTFRNQTLSLSGNHLIYARHSFQERFNPMLVFSSFLKWKMLLQTVIKMITIFKATLSQKTIFSPRYADQVSIGDEVVAQGYDGLSPTMVINVIDQFVQGKQCYKTVITFSKLLNLHT